MGKWMPINIWLEEKEKEQELTRVEYLEMKRLMENQDASGEEST